MIFLAAALLLLGPGAFADEIPVYRLDEIVVTAGRVPSTLSHCGRSVLVLSRERIERAPASTLAGLLEYAGGVDMQVRGAHGVQADIGIRGASFEQTLILVDGMKVGDPQTGHHLMNIPLTLSDVERIEVLRGHGSRLFGPNAFGGVVNVITRRGRPRSLSVKVEGGDFGLVSGSFSLSHQWRGTSHRVSAEKSRSDGYHPHTEFDIASFSYGLDVKAGSGGVDALFGWQDKAFGASTFYSDRYPNQWERTTAAFVSLAGRWKAGALSFRPGLCWRGHEDDYMLDSERPDWYRNRHSTDVFNAEMQITMESRLGTVSLGGETGREILASSGLGDRERDRSGVFLEHRLPEWKGFDMAAGVFACGYTHWGRKAYPGADVAVTLARGVRAFGSVGGAFRVPTYTELYYDSPANKGNAGLRPEEALSYEAGVIAAGIAHRASIAVFRRDSRRVIDWVRASESEPWLARNIAELVTSGIEADLEWLPRIHYPRQPVDRLSLSYAWSVSDRELRALESKYALSYLRHQVTLGLEHALPFGLRQTWAVRYKERLNTAGFIVADARTAKRIKGAEFFLAATNLFDASYRDVSSVIMPGRWFRVGATFDVWK